MTAFLEILSAIFNSIFTITVPGLNISFWQLLAGFFLINLAISLVRWLLGLSNGDSKAD